VEWGWYVNNSPIDRIRDIVPEIIDSGPMCITDLFQNKSVAYFNPKKNTFHFFFKKTHLYNMQLFSADATIFCFCPWKHKKLPLKVAYLWQFAFFFSAAPTAQNSPELNIRFIDSCIQWSVVLYLGIRSKYNNALSFYRSQNVLCRSKFFEPVQKFDCI
jgi:hypothetical protein